MRLASPAIGLLLAGLLACAVSATYDLNSYAEVVASRSLLQAGGADGTTNTTTTTDTTNTTDTTTGNTTTTDTTTGTNTTTTDTTTGTNTTDTTGTGTNTTDTTGTGTNTTDPTPTPAAACVEVPGYKLLKGVDQKGATIQQIAGPWTPDNINTPIATGAPGKLAAACNSQCNCTAFNSDGFLKSVATTDTTGLADTFCFYQRNDPVACSLPPNIPDSPRALISVGTDKTSCWAWNGTTVSTSPCVRKSAKTNDQLLVLGTSSDLAASLGYLTLKSGVNESRCLEVTNNSTSPEFLKLASSCTNATNQQFAVWTLLATNQTLLVSRSSGLPLKKTPDGIFQTWYDASAKDDFVQNIELEPTCGSVPGYLTIRADVSDPIYSLAGIAPAATAAAAAAACTADCRCKGFDSLNTLKNLAVDPLAAGPYGSCYFLKSVQTACCPDIPGYNKTVGVARSTDDSILRVPYNTSWAGPGTPVSAAALLSGKNFCDTSCQCLSFGIGTRIPPSPIGRGSIDNVWIFPTVSASPPAGTGDQCIYTKLATVNCTTAPEVFNASTTGRRILFNVPFTVGVTVAANVPGPPINCLLATPTGMQVWGNSGPDNCYTRPAALFSVTGDGAGAAFIKDGSGRCLQSAAKDAPVTWANCTTATNIKFVIRSAANSVNGSSNLEITTPDGLCLYANTVQGPIAARTCPTFGQLAFQSGSRYYINTDTNCTDIPGYVTAWYKRPKVASSVKLNFTALNQTVVQTAAECDKNCKCTGFSNLDPSSVWPTEDYPTEPGAFGECYYIKLAVADCACPIVPGFRSYAGRTLIGSDYVRVAGTPTTDDLLPRCGTDCKCQAFSTTGQLKTVATAPNSLSANPLECYYTKTNNTGKCTQLCAPNNLGCITQYFPAANLGKLSGNLPDLGLPGGASKIQDYLTPGVLVGIVQGLVAGKEGGGANTAITAGLTAAEYIKNLQCPGAGLPIFSGGLIRSGGFLGILASDSCRFLGVVDQNQYIVGALSTEVKQWRSLVPEPVVTVVNAIQTFAGAAPQFGPLGKPTNFAVCLAMDPCNLDFHLGFVGLSTTFKLPVVPPVTVNLTFNSISYSNNGEGAGIQKTNLGLWRYNDTIDALPDGSAIFGNLFVQATVTFSWGFTAGTSKIAALEFVSTVKMVIRWTPPVTKFALQIVTRPRITLFDDKFFLDFSKFEKALDLTMLFYVERYSETNYNIYMGVAIQLNFGKLITAVVPGKLGAALSFILASSDSGLTTTFNLHIDQNGAGLRLLFKGIVEFGPPIVEAMKVIAPKIPTRFEAGLGVMLRMQKSRGEMKVFGFALVGKKVYSVSFCASDEDCLENEQVCFIGTCQKRVACLASIVRPWQDLKTVGLCPNVDSLGLPIPAGKIVPVAGDDDCRLECTPRNGVNYVAARDESDNCKQVCDCPTWLYNGASKFEICARPSKFFGGCAAFNPKGPLRLKYQREYPKSCPAGSDQGKNPVTGGPNEQCFVACPGSGEWVPGLPGKSDARARNRCYLTATPALVAQGKLAASGCPPQYPKRCPFVVEVDLGIAKGTIQEEYCVWEDVDCGSFKAFKGGIKDVCKL